MIWIYQGHWLLDFCTVSLTMYNIHCGWLKEPGADAWTSSKAKLCVHKPFDVWTAGTGGKRSYFVCTLQAQCCLHAVFRSQPQQCPPGKDSVIDLWCLPCVRQQVLLPFTHPISPWMLCFPSPPSATAPPSKGKADPTTAHLHPCPPGHPSHSEWNPWAIHHRPSLHQKGSHHIGLLTLPQTQQGHSCLRVLEASSSIRNILRHQIPMSRTPYCLHTSHWCKAALLTILSAISSSFILYNTFYLTCIVSIIGSLPRPLLCLIPYLDSIGEAIVSSSLMEYPELLEQYYVLFLRSSQ